MCSRRWPTLVAGAIRLDMRSSNLAVHNLEGITLAANTTKDGGAIEAKVESFSEGCGGVTQEANLKTPG